MAKGKGLKQSEVGKEQLLSHSEVQIRVLKMCDLLYNYSTDKITPELLESTAKKVGLKSWIVPHYKKALKNINIGLQYNNNFESTLEFLWDIGIIGIPCFMIPVFVSACAFKEEYSAVKKEVVKITKVLVKRDKLTSNELNKGIIKVTDKMYSMFKCDTTAKSIKDIVRNAGMRDWLSDSLGRAVYQLRMCDDKGYSFDNAVEYVMGVEIMGIHEDLAKLITAAYMFKEKYKEQRKEYIKNMKKFGRY